MTTAVITFNGRITLPSQVRRKLGLKLGDNVEFVENEKGQFAIAAGAGRMSSDDSEDPNFKFAPSGDQLQEIHY
jgi:AbrB family looped-hinge helix DNA binding protein